VTGATGARAAFDFLNNGADVNGTDVTCEVAGTPIGPYSTPVPVVNGGLIGAALGLTSTSPAPDALTICFEYNYQ